MPPTERPILFHYPPSIYSHRVLWYLWLRGIPYDECIQPPVKPRPDLEALDINYRRIPIMAISKDIYCDSRLIIAKLESMYPNSALTPPSAFEAGIRKLFENWTIDGGIFGNACKLMPYWTSSGLLQNKTFLDDRQSLMHGRRMTAELMEANRPDGLQHITQALEILEGTFLADGRKWILGTKEPTLADIDGVWPFEWLIVDHYMKEALPAELEKKFPKVYAWVQRFMDEMERAKRQAPKPTTLDGNSMSSRITNPATQPLPLVFIDNDPLQLKRGDEVEVFASDYGYTHRDRGAAIGLTTQEIVIRNSKGLHLHFPRWNFRINKIQPKSVPAASVSKPSKKIPSMRLIYHHFSPFTRKVFMLAIELGLASHIKLEKVVVCPIPFPGWSDNNDDVATYNPMAKIPCLVSEDVPDGIYDSRTICDYLSSLSGEEVKKDKKYWQLRTLHACADGIMDAAVLITYEVRIRKERGLKFDEWIEGQKVKINRGLDRFEAATKEGILDQPSSDGPVSADEVAVVAATAMTETMLYLGIEWQDGRPNLTKWIKVWEGRKSFIETPPQKDWSVDVEVKSTSKI